MIYIYCEPKNGADGGPHYQGPDNSAPHEGFRHQADAEAALAELCGEFWTGRVVELDNPPAELWEATKRLDGF